MPKLKQIHIYILLVFDQFNLDLIKSDSLLIYQEQ